MNIIIQALIFALLWNLVHSVKPCHSCKWFVSNGQYPKCAFWETNYDVLGGKIFIQEYAEHCRKNENLCGKEGYMHEPIYGEDEGPSAYLTDAAKIFLFWPSNTR